MNKAAANVLDPNCGSRRVLDMLADRWSILVIYGLQNKTMRFSELERLLGDISQKMLTQTLHKLERNGMVIRTAYPVVPPKVEYRLSPMGQSLVKTLSPLCHWAEVNLDTIEENRAAYDDAH
jgi:DNA-binding HxlR family transcriptional regulator